MEFHDTILHFSAKACLATPAAVFTSRAVQARHVKYNHFLFLIELFLKFFLGQAESFPSVRFIDFDYILYYISPLSFINNRSVECPRLQRSFDAVFTAKDSLCPVRIIL